jgi:hypothetical protein
MSDPSSSAAAPQTDVEGIGDNDLSQRLSLSFATLMVGQLFSGESDYPYDPFWAEASPQWQLTPDLFRTILGFDESRDVRMSAVHQPTEPDGDSYDQILAFRLYVTLLTQMRTALGRLHQVYVGGENIVQVPYFLFGRLKGGNLVGLRSTDIQT